MSVSVKEFLHSQYLKVLLVALTFLILGRPVFEDFEHSRIIQSALFTIILFASCWSIKSRSLIIVAFVSATVVNVVWFLSSFNEHPYCCTTTFHLVSLWAAIIFLTISCGAILKQVLSEGFVDANKLCGVVTVYLLFGFVFALVFECALIADPTCLVATTSNVKLFDPTTFEADMEIVYYSFVTLSTLGYGDIVPTSTLTRTLALAEAVIGQLFIAILIARLVSLSVMHDRSDDGDS